MHGNRLEKELVEHCAPTLAGIKSAGLFSYFYTDETLAGEELRAVNATLNERGVYVEALVWREASVLIYAYRRSHLEKELRQTGVSELLAGYGYEDDRVDGCLNHLKERVAYDSCFPHEIGVFLGYPLEDVKGFIEHGGRDCKSCGLWKVYCDTAYAQHLFDKMGKCSRVYRQVFLQGRSLAQLTVCA